MVSSRESKEWQVKQVLALGAVLLIGWGAGAHEPMHRVSVLPFVAPAELKEEAETAWWSVREELTSLGRFLVATKRVMLTRDVFVPRLHLKPSEAIALSQTLDADAIATGGLEDSQVVLRLYGRERGSLLWELRANFASHRPAKDQVDELFRQLAQQLLVDVPYQGHVTNRGSSSGFQSSQVGQLVAVTLGKAENYRQGDQVIFGNLLEVGAQALFQGGGEFQPVAYGQIVRLDPPIAQVRLSSVAQGRENRLAPLAVVPSGADRLKVELGMSHEIKVPLPSTLSNASQLDREERDEEVHRVVAVLSWVGSLVAMLLLAF